MRSTSLSSQQRGVNKYEIKRLFKVFEEDGDGVGKNAHYSGYKPPTERTYARTQSALGLLLCDIKSDC